MSLRRAAGSKLTWVPVGVLVVVAAVLTATSLASAAGPALPGKTPAQLLVAMRDAKPPTAMSGVITENANLGFPAIPNIAGLSSQALSAATLLTGTHTVEVWYDGPGHVRIAVPVSFGETDLRVNDGQVWLWQSHTQTATHYIFPRRPVFRRVTAPPRVLPGLRCIAVLHREDRKAGPKPKAYREQVVKCIKRARAAGPEFARPLTPQQAADKLLAAIGPSTKVSVAGTTSVAGRAAYVLQIAPRTSQSLIDRIDVAVDAKTYLPLQVQVFSRGMTSPAFQLGFTSLTLARPAMSNFTFTPPAGAHVKTEHLPSFDTGGFGAGGFGAGGFGGGFRGGWHGGWHAVPRIHPIPQPVHGRGAAKSSAIKSSATKSGASKGGSRKIVRAKVVLPAGPNPQGYPNPPGLRSPTLFPLAEPGGLLPGAPIPVGLPGLPFGVGLPGTQVLGKAWLSVVEIQALPALTAVHGADLPGHSSVAYRSSLSIHFRPAPGGTTGNFVALIKVLLNAATPVHGSWGSGKLLRTSLFSALITSKGTVLIGAVNPAVLYADAAKVK